MIEGITYEQTLRFAQSWGAVYFVIMFAVAFAYAWWPGNRETFRNAATSLFREDDGP
jgi:cytochrome c oxidase cbb3-type subunit 4